MNIKRIVIMLGTLILSSALLFTGCTQKGDAKPAEDKKVEEKKEEVKTEDKKEEKKEEEKKEDKKEEDKKSEEKSSDKVSLSEWEGTWNNMGAYLDQEELQPAFKTVAEKEKKTPEEVKAAYVEKRKCDFDGLVIEGDKATLLDGFKDKDGKEIETVEYEYSATHKVKHGNHDLEWVEFKAKGDAKYPVLLMMPVHGEESLTHFHMRYGSNAEELLKKDGWYPTFIKPNSTTEQLIEEITE